ncbi:MAG: ATP-binding protein, partial [Methylicorpusculum sp.]|nr:ATP-binding protein [Methylicorpusculum sp.]
MKLYKKFPVIAIVGPRQSGKTTLAQKLFPKHTFISFEIPANRMLATQDPERFLLAQENKHGIIFDEFQYVPQLLSYIQVDADAKKRHNYFILTGSQNFLMNQAITQSLAGRVGIITLLPLSLHELKKNKLLSDNPHEVVFNGFYPRLHDETINPTIFYASYIQTYVERDVRQLVTVGDLEAFQKFIQLCAARIGNLLNLSDLAMGCGVSVPTARRWLSILQASYIVFLLEPHFTNFNKRLTKLPKIYFYDTGLACSLLRIPSAQNLLINSYWGNLFENCIIADMAKQYCNLGAQPPLYFWRDKNGRIEIDCLIDDGTRLFPVEIKASQTISSRFFTSLAQWQELAKSIQSPDPQASNSFLVYAGNRRHLHAHADIIPWKE